jgi:hypothetical protein
MESTLIGLYLTMFILIGMIWYAGIEGTMRVFAYFELQVKFFFIRVQLYFMKRRLEKQLGMPSKFTDF